MDYLEASKRFNLDMFLLQINELDYLDILKQLNREIDNCENIKVPQKNQYRDIEYLKNEYVSNLKGLTFLLSQGIKPFSVDKKTLLKFKPLLTALINKKQMKETVLKLIE